MRDFHTFFKKAHQKWKYYREEKQDFEIFLIFLNVIKYRQNKKKKNSMKGL